MSGTGLKKIGSVGSVLPFSALLLLFAAQPPQAPQPPGPPSPSNRPRRQASEEQELREDKGTTGKPVDMQGKACWASECHDKLRVKKFLHGPVAQGKCTACHLQPKGERVHSFTLAYGPKKHCLGCHTMQEKNIVHKPVAEGKCTDCHDAHQADWRFMLKEDPAQKLCLSCHKDEAFMKKKFLHGPVAGGTCIVCHQAHSSWYPKLLIRQAEDLCFFCHDAIKRRTLQSRHVHKPVAQGECLRCHDSHGSDQRMLVPDQPRELCLQCHERVQKLIDTSLNVHKAVEQDRQCGNCHAAHGTTLPNLLKASQMDLCLSCHNKEIELPDGSRLVDMATLLKDNPNYHGPLRRADCSSCHEPHASPNWRLLSKVYPEFFYAPFDLGNYDLCFQCHQRDMVLIKNGQGLTRFKNDTLNLHFVHVNKKTKGRTCRACHEVHASKHPVHARDKVPFGPGGWAFDLNFQRTDQGGSCAPGCHRKKDYVRDAAAIVLPPPRETIPSEERPAGENEKNAQEEPR